MRLLSCYIENYGKIKQREFTFAPTITSFLWENGEGKSTLASFLKAMLYGLKGYDKRTVKFCDREHFYPFDGGRFGGNLRVQVEGKEYKIERFFDEKSEKGDTLTVYEAGVRLSASPDDLGKALLGVDKESFERTLFLRHDDLEITSTSGIHAKLNQLLEGGDEEGGLDEALQRLDKAAKVYKKRGGGDKITQAQERVKDLKIQIENAATVKRSLEEKYVRADGLRRRLREVQEGIALAQKERELASQREHYDSLLEGVLSAERGLAALTEKYPYGVPTVEESKAFNAHLGAYNQLQMKIDGASLTQEEERAYAALNARFAEGAPAQEALSRAEEGLEEWRGLKVTLDRQSAALKKEVGFARPQPTEAAMQAAEKNLTAYKEKRRALEDTPAFTSMRGEKASFKGYALAAVAAVLLLLAGVGVLAWGLVPLGGVLAAVGGVGLLAVGFLYLNKKSSGQNALTENFERSVLERQARDLEAALRAFLLPLGYTEENVEVAFAALQRDEREREEEGLAHEHALQSFSQNKTKLAKVEEELRAFFAAYGEREGDFSARLLSLKTALVRLQALTARAENCKKLCDGARAEQARFKEKMAAYQEKYRLQRVDADALLEDGRAKEGFLRAIAEGKAKANAFKREKGLQEDETVGVADLEGLQEEGQDLQEELARLDREIAEDERSAELLEGYEREKDLVKEALEAYKRKHALLTATTELLQGAAGRLRDKYVKPVKDEFLRYAALLEKALGEKVVMTKDFALRFERNGVERSEKHLSSGQRSICALCFRLALVKNMYEGRLPFLVLDDPFTALDEEHIARVQELLKALSKDIQMVYLTCHPSRAL